MVPIGEAEDREERSEREKEGLKEKAISGGKSNSEREDKRDGEERKVRARGRENIEMRGVDLHWLDLTSVKLRSKRGLHIPPAVILTVLHSHSPCTHYLKTHVSSRPRPVLNPANHHVLCKSSLS